MEAATVEVTALAATDAVVATVAIVVATDVVVATVVAVATGVVVATDAVVATGAVVVIIVATVVVVVVTVKDGSVSDNAFTSAIPFTDALDCSTPTLRHDVGATAVTAWREAVQRREYAFVACRCAWGNAEAAERLTTAVSSSSRWDRAAAAILRNSARGVGVGAVGDSACEAKGRSEAVPCASTAADRNGDVVLDASLIRSSMSSLPPEEAVGEASLERSC